MRSNFDRAASDRRLAILADERRLLARTALTPALEIGDRSRLTPTNLPGVFMPADAWALLQVMRERKI